MPTLQRTVYIGLGGAGIKSIRNTKERFIESYGEVPPMIRFIGIDTDYCEYEEDRGGVKLAPAEFCHLRVPCGVYECYSQHRDEFSWLREANVRGLDLLGRYGAGQIRTNGRFAFVLNVRTIQHTILQVVRAVEAVVYTPKYLTGGGPVAINVTFSLAGGTGCGIFLDVAYLIRKLFGNNVRLNGYAILPGVYRALPNTRNIFGNGYAALQELDFLMHLKPEDEPVTFNWISERFDEEDFRRSPTPYDIVYLIDNVNQRGYQYDRDQLLENVGLALFAAGGQIGIQNGALFATLRYPLQNGDFNIDNKRPWASGLGVSEIVFDGKKAAGVFAMMVAGRMVRQALSTDGCYGSVAPITWAEDIDITPQRLAVKLCSTRQPSFGIQRLKDVMVEQLEYLDHILTDARLTVDHFVKKYLPPALLALKAVVSDCLRQGNSVPMALGFIADLEGLVDSFIKDTENDRSDYENKRKVLKWKMDLVTRELEEQARRFFSFSSSKQQLANECEVQTSEYAINEIEILRRQGAVRFYESLMQELENLRIMLEQKNELLRQLAVRLEERDDALVRNNQRFSSSVDLSVETARSMPSSEIAPGFGDFLRSLGDEGWERIHSVEDLEQAFHSFAEGLPQYCELRDLTVLARISTMTAGEFADIIGKSLDLAYPLIRTDGRHMHFCRTYPWQIIGMEGYRPFTSFADCQDLGLGALSVIDGADYVTTDLKDRVIFYFHERMFAPFMIDNIEYWGEQRHADRLPVDPYFDAHIHARMIREHFSLEPLGD